jgi:hypothetical protein
MFEVAYALTSPAVGEPLDELSRYEGVNGDETRGRHGLYVHEHSFVADFALLEFFLQVAQDGVEAEC